MKSTENLSLCKLCAILGQVLILEVSEGRIFPSLFLWKEVFLQLIKGGDNC